MATKVGIGIVGCGSMGGIHAACFAAQKGAALVGLVNRTRDKAEALAGQWGAPVFDSLDELLACPRLDAVCIATSQQAHAAQAVAVLRAGKHLLCEKPLALTVAEMDRIEAAAKAAGKVVMVGHQLRYHPVVDALRQALPRLGTPFHLQLEAGFLISGHEGRCWENYRSGGFFMELGCHLVDLARLLMGDIRDLSAYALRLNPKRVTEDLTHCLLQFDSGAVGSIVVSANHRIKRQGLFRGRLLGAAGRLEFSIYPYSRGNNRASLILDQGQTIFVPDTTTEKLSLRQAPSPFKTYPGFFDVYQRQARAFLESVRGGQAPPVTLADGRAAIEGVLAAYAAQGRATTKPNFPPASSRVAGEACHPLVRK